MLRNLELFYLKKALSGALLLEKITFGRKGMKFGHKWSLFESKGKILQKFG
jgi:hypothetical protein